MLDGSELMGVLINFVRNHDPREFARANFTEQSPVFSIAWLMRLEKALSAEAHPEAQAFAAFHFAMAAQLSNNFLQLLESAKENTSPTRLFVSTIHINWLLVLYE